MIISRKKIVSWILSVVCTPSLLATTSPGENIWQMVKDVGIQTDTIATLATASSSGCIHTIKQSDVATKTYTISQPGLYCLTENLTSTFNPIITINASNVVLDLQHHTIFGNTLNDGIRTNTVIKNHVAIQDGNIRNCNNGIFIGTGINVLLIQDMQILNATSIGIRTLFPSTTAMTNILINRCNIINTSTASGVVSILLDGNNTQSNNIVIKNCYLKCPPAPDGNYSTLIDINNLCIYDCYLQGEGINVASCNNFLLKNMTSSFEGGILQQVNSNGIVDNCFVLGPISNINASFENTFQTNSTIQNCVSISPIGYGIVSSQSTNNIIKQCIAMASSLYGIAEDFAPNVNIQYYANIARGNTVSNYFNVTVAPVVTTPTAATGYWANVN